MRRLLMVALVMVLAGGCTRFKKILDFQSKKQSQNDSAIVEESKALTTAEVDTLALAPSNQFTSLALEFARKDQLLEGLPQIRIDVDGLLNGDRQAVKDLEGRYQFQKDLIAEKAKIAAELEATKAQLVEMGKKYEEEHNKGIVKRIWHWAIGTFGLAGAIAFIVICPGIALPIATQLARGIISAVPQMSKLFGVVGKGAWDASVRAIEETKGSLDDKGRQTLEGKLSSAMDRAHKRLVKVTKIKEGLVRVHQVA